MNITQILYSGLGGHGNVAYSFVETESNTLNNSLIFYGIEEVKPEYKEKCKEHQLKYKGVLKKQGLDLKSYLLVYKELKVLKPDAIILHSIVLIVPTFFYCLLNNSKLIAVEHNANSAKRTSEWVWSFLALYLAKKVVYLTKEYKNEVKNKFNAFFRKRKAVVIPNGLNTNVYSPSIEKEEKEIRLGMVSRMNKLRDHESLVKAFKLLTQKLTGKNLKLYIAGNGDTHRATVELVKNEKLEDSVVFTGMLNENELLLLLKKLDIYVHATFAETMSTSLMQALSCGLPIVASDISGVRNLIENQKNGILLDTRNVELFSKTLKKLIENKNQQKELSKNARKFAVKNLSNEQMFQNYFKLIQS